MDINIYINDLITSIKISRKIWLNDNMLILQLYNDKDFYNWLSTKSVSINGRSEPLQPKIKKSHGRSNTISYDKTGNRTGEDLKPIFITMCIIKNKTSDIDYSCCKMNLNQLSNNIFTNIQNDSGLVLNGTFFIMRQYLQQDTIYSPIGSRPQKTIYGISNITNEFKSIGYYTNSLDNKGIKNETIIKSGIETALDPIDSTNENTRTFTLDWVKNTIGYLKIDSSGLITVEKTIDDSIDKNKQVLLGHLLIFNGDILFDEIELLPKCVLKTDIIYLGKNINKNTVISLAKPKIGIIPNTINDLDIMTPDDINSIGINDEVYFKGDNLIGKTKYNLYNLFPLYSTNLIRHTYRDNFSSYIPGGSPVHASDLNPRTCIIIDEKDNIFTLNVEGRHNICGGIGIDLFDLAKICKTMGAKFALNLDGGNSAKIIYKEIGNIPNYIGFDNEITEKVGVLNNYEIGNAIVIKPK
jgi:hypothetical protein